MQKDSQRTMLACKKNLILQFQSLLSSLHFTPPGLGVHNPKSPGGRQFISNPQVSSDAFSSHHSIAMVQDITKVYERIHLHL